MSQLQIIKNANLPLWEDDSTAETYLAKFTEHFQPQNFVQEHIVSRLAGVAYRQQRILGFETALLSQNRFKGDQLLNASPKRVIEHLSKGMEKRDYAQFCMTLEKLHKDTLLEICRILKEAGLEPFDNFKTNVPWGFMMPKDLSAIDADGALYRKFVQWLSHKSPMLHAKWHAPDRIRTAQLYLIPDDRGCGFIDFSRYGDKGRLLFRKNPKKSSAEQQQLFALDEDLLSLVAFIAFTEPFREPWQREWELGRSMTLFEEGMSFLIGSEGFRNLAMYERHLDQTFGDLLDQFLKVSIATNP